MPTNKSFDYIVKEFSEITKIPEIEANKIAKDFIEALKRILISLVITNSIISSALLIFFILSLLLPLLII